MLADAARHGLVVTAEDGVRHGGAGAFLIDAMAAYVESAGRAAPATRVLGVPRQYLAQGRADDILASLGLDGAGIAESVRRARLVGPADRPPRLNTDAGRPAARRRRRHGRRSGPQARLAPFCRTKSLTA